MTDIDRRHNFALRRLSSRAASTPTTPLAGLHSFTPLISSLITQLQMSKIPLHRPGLSDPQITKIESLFNFTFPPDLRSFYSLSLPSSPSFPNFLSFSSLSSHFSLPLLSLSLSPHFSLRKLKRAPVLIPIYQNCYVPSRPSLAGNPVFYIDDDSFFCCAVDLQDFFSRFFLTGSGSSTRTARWVEFWTDAAKRFNRVSTIDRSSFSSMSSSSSSTTMSADVDPERYVEIRPVKGVPKWMGRYLDEIGGALKNGGWDEKEVEEMMHVSESCALDCEEGEEVVKDVLEMRMERWSEELRRAGWEGLDLGQALREGERSRKAIKLPTSVQFKFDRLVEQFVT